MNKLVIAFSALFLVWAAPAAAEMPADLESSVSGFIAASSSDNGFDAGLLVLAEDNPDYAEDIVYELCSAVPSQCVEFTDAVAALFDGDREKQRAIYSSSIFAILDLFDNEECDEGGASDNAATGDGGCGVILAGLRMSSVSTTGNAGSDGGTN